MVFSEHQFSLESKEKLKNRNKYLNKQGVVHLNHRHVLDAFHKRSVSLYENTHLNGEMSRYGIHSSVEIILKLTKLRFNHKTINFKKYKSRIFFKSGENFISKHHSGN